MKQFILVTILLFSNYLFSQNVTITIDDVPNTTVYKRDNYNSKLLKVLDSLHVPVTIFINEGKIFKTDSISKNKKLLEEWIQRDYITIGNHTYGHLKYSETEINTFSDDLLKGEFITKQFAEKHGKSITYFRLTYNDLGKDSSEHVQLESLLTTKGYKITPFTIESLDWMCNYVYEYYLNQKDFIKAHETGEYYVSKSIELFTFFDSITLKEYGRKINHIYLCHDNTLNANYLPLLIKKLKSKNYSFIDLESTLKDSIYFQKDYYYKKWGISWVYRWMKTQDERIFYMKKEPSMEKIENLYEKLISENSKG